jgi:hypothetical protein
VNAFSGPHASLPCETSICHADVSERLCTTLGIVSTRYVAPRHVGDGSWLDGRPREFPAATIKRDVGRCGECNEPENEERALPIISTAPTSPRSNGSRDGRHDGHDDRRAERPLEDKPLVFPKRHT